MDKATKTYIDFMSKDVVKIMRERQKILLSLFKML
jgi:hypothetical protein